jgi:hypothetical protein
VLAVQIFDQKKFKKKDQGFLGVVNVRIGNVIDLDAGGDGKIQGSFLLPFFPCLLVSAALAVCTTKRG